ncbi:MAG: thioredoxin family protein [Polyangiales bacterium]
MPTTEVTKDNIAQIMEGNDTVILDCWATWCGPCTTFSPIYEAASERHPDVLWGKIDVDAQRELAGEFQIRSVPTVMVFRQGILLFQESTILPPAALDEIVSKVQELDMDDVRKKIEEAEAEHARAHAEGRCNHEH